MDDVKIKVIDSDKLVKAINEGSYDINLSAVMALGAVMMDSLPSAQSVPYEEDGELDFVQEHKKLPIILETRSKGHWIEVGREEGALGVQYKKLRCSKCGWGSSLPIPRKFCPECGCDMRGEQDAVN